MYFDGSESIEFTISLKNFYIAIPIEFDGWEDAPPFDPGYIVNQIISVIPIVSLVNLMSTYAEDKNKVCIRFYKRTHNEDEGSIKIAVDTDTDGSFMHALLVLTVMFYDYCTLNNELFKKKYGHSWGC